MVFNPSNLGESLPWKLILSKHAYFGLGLLQSKLLLATLAPIWAQKEGMGMHRPEVGPARGGPQSASACLPSPHPAPLRWPVSCFR